MNPGPGAAATASGARGADAGGAPAAAIPPDGGWRERLRRAPGSAALVRRTPFLWGLVEATVFVIVPDVAIGYVALHRLRDGLRACAWAVAGATVGGLLVYAAPAWWQDVFPHLPGIPRPMMDDAAGRLARHGAWAVVGAPLEGQPYKLYAAEWALQGRSWWTLALLTPVARGWRFVAVALLCAGIGRVLRGPLDRYPASMAGTYVVAWVVQYALYFRWVDAVY